MDTTQFLIATGLQTRTLRSGRPGCSTTSLTRSWAITHSHLGWNGAPYRGTSTSRTMNRELTVLTVQLPACLRLRTAGARLPAFCSAQSAADRLTVG